MLLLHDADQK